MTWWILTIVALVVLLFLAYRFAMWWLWRGGNWNKD